MGLLPAECGAGHTGAFQPSGGAAAADGHKYAITEIISVLAPRPELRKAIARHDAVILNDVAGIKRNDILKY